MGTIEKLPVDYEKLLDELKKRNLKCVDVSKEMGYSSTYLAHISSRKEVRRSTVIQLENMYGIKYDDIKPVEETHEPPAQVQVMERVQDGVVDALETINSTLQAINANLTALTEQSNRALNLVEPLKDPMALYKTIFLPIYAAIKAGEVDKAESDEKKRRIDGTLNLSGYKRSL